MDCSPRFHHEPIDDFLERSGVVLSEFEVAERRRRDHVLVLEEQRRLEAESDGLSQESINVILRNFIEPEV